MVNAQLSTGGVRTKPSLTIDDYLVANNIVNEAMNQ